MYHHSRYFQLNPLYENEIKSGTSIKVMSFNVRLFDLYNWTENNDVKQKIIELIKDQNPDIVCFQEYYYQKSNDFITRELIIEELQLPFYHESFSDESRNNSYFGLATFSKFPANQ